MRVYTVKQQIDDFFKQSKGLAVITEKVPRAMKTKLKRSIKTVY